MKVMRFLLPVICCGLASCGFSPGGTSAPPTGGSTVSQSHTLIFRRGDGPRDFDAIFPVRNPSANPLVVELTGKTCGCVGLFHEPDGAVLDLKSQFIIPPRAAADLRLRLQAGTTPGLVSQAATLRLSGADGDRSVSLRSNLMVVAEVVTSPAALAFEAVESDKSPQPKTLNIIRHRAISDSSRGELVPPIPELPRELRLIEGPTLMSTTTNENYETATWRLTLASDRAALLNEPLYLKLNLSWRDPLMRTATVPITINPPNGPRAIPSLVRIPEVAVGEAARGRFLLLDRSGSKFKITQVTSSDPSFLAHPAGVGPNDRQWVDVTFKPTRSGEFAADIQIILDDETDHPLKVQAIASSSDS